MDRRFPWVYIMFLVVETVSSQEKVQGFTGGEALLTCIYNEMDVKDVNLFWRDLNDKNVYDVLNNQPDMSNQDPLYNNRASVFPQEYSKGNFSLLLKDLKLSDSGRFTCFIPEVNILRQVDLTVSDKPERESDGSSIPRNDGVSVRGKFLHLVFLLPLLQMFLPK